jgi:hypothetical protein
VENDIDIINNLREGVENDIVDTLNEMIEQDEREVEKEEVKLAKTKKGTFLRRKKLSPWHRHLHLSL